MVEMVFRAQTTVCLSALDFMGHFALDLTDPSLLPHLTELEIREPWMLGFIPRRPLQGLTIKVNRFNRTDGLRLFHDTLTRLSFHGGKASYEELKQHMMFVTENIPKLKHLKYRLAIQSFGDNFSSVRFYAVIVD